MILWVRLTDLDQVSNLLSMLLVTTPLLLWQMTSFPDLAFVPSKLIDVARWSMVLLNAQVKARIFYQFAPTGLLIIWKRRTDSIRKPLQSITEFMPALWKKKNTIMVALFQMFQTRLGYEVTDWKFNLEFLFLFSSTFRSTELDITFVPILCGQTIDTPKSLKQKLTKQRKELRLVESSTDSMLDQICHTLTLTKANSLLRLKLLCIHDLIKMQSTNLSVLRFIKQSP